MNTLSLHQSGNAEARIISQILLCDLNIRSDIYPFVGIDLRQALAITTRAQRWMSILT